LWGGSVSSIEEKWTSKPASFVHWALKNGPALPECFRWTLRKLARVGRSASLASAAVYPDLKENGSV
jgi:hypothetical protein